MWEKSLTLQWSHLVSSPSYSRETAHGLLCTVFNSVWRMRLSNLFMKYEHLWLVMIHRNQLYNHYFMPIHFCFKTHGVNNCFNHNGSYTRRDNTRSVARFRKISSAILYDVLRSINTLRRRQNGRHFADDTFKRMFLNEDYRNSIRNSPKFVPNGQINNIPALVQIMAWRRPGDKPLSEPMLVSLLTHICVTRPQWVKVRLNYWWPETFWKRNNTYLHF